MTMFDKFRIRSLFNYYWTRNWKNKGFLAFWTVLTALIIIHGIHDKHPVYIGILLVWGSILMALSSNLNPAWRATRIEFRAVHNSGMAKTEVPRPQLVSQHDRHKWGNVVGHAERKRYGHHRIRKCEHCGALELTDTNNFVRVWVKDGMVFKKEPLCQVWK